MSQRTYVVEFSAVELAVCINALHHYAARDKTDDEQSVTAYSMADYLERERPK